MTQGAKESDAAYAAALLVHYSFERGGYTAEELIAEWGKDYPTPWLRLAVIEALYQGRYKAISVKHILGSWKRRGQPLYHFNLEFETLVSGNLPKSFDEDKSDRAAKRVSPYSVALKSSLTDSGQQGLSAKGENRSGQEIGRPSASSPPPSANDSLPKARSAEPEEQSSPSSDTIPDPWLEPAGSEAPTSQTTSQTTSQNASQATSQTAKPIGGETSASETPAPETSLPQSAEAKQGDRAPVQDKQKSSIGQFTPKLESSEVYAKLKATIRRNPFQDSP